MKERWLRQFNTAFGTDEDDEATTFNGSIPQALTLMNGDLVRRATGNQPGSMLARVAGDPKLDNAREDPLLVPGGAVAAADAAGAEHQQRAAGGPRRQRRRGAAGYLVGAAEYE